MKAKKIFCIKHNEKEKYLVFKDNPEHIVTSDDEFEAVKCATFLKESEDFRDQFEHMKDVAGSKTEDGLKIADFYLSSPVFYKKQYKWQCPNDCFARINKTYANDGGCSILTTTSWNKKCPFYKSKEQAEKDRIKYKTRLQDSF